MAEDAGSTPASVSMLDITMLVTDIADNTPVDGLNIEILFDASAETEIKVYAFSEKILSNMLYLCTECTKGSRSRIVFKDAAPVSHYSLTGRNTELSDS